MAVKRVPVGTCVALAILVAAIAGSYADTHAQNNGGRTFFRQIRELSEPGGTFDTDNLISNERSYLQVLPALRQRRVRGGVYIGVGPDQNFSYIAAVRPVRAFVIDVRRDNLLLQLLFKAVFEVSDSRAEYLSHLFGRRLPGPADLRRGATLDKIVSQLEEERPNEATVRALRAQIDGQIAQFGVPLSSADKATIDRFHRTFIDAGLSLKFQSWGRPPRSYYPTYRELLFETDSEDRRGNFLVSEADYQFVRDMQQRDLIVPVVGDLAGPSALAAVGAVIKQRGETASAIYVSNVELYLFQNGVFPRYVENLSAVPHDTRSVIIRSIFSGPGSTSVVQSVDDFMSHRYATYSQLLPSFRY